MTDRASPTTMRATRFIAHVLAALPDDLHTSFDSRASTCPKSSSVRRHRPSRFPIRKVTSRPPAFRNAAAATASRREHDERDPQDESLCSRSTLMISRVRIVQHGDPRASALLLQQRRCENRPRSYVHDLPCRGALLRAADRSLCPLGYAAASPLAPQRNCSHLSRRADRHALERPRDRLRALDRRRVAAAALRRRSARAASHRPRRSCSDPAPPRCSARHASYASHRASPTVPRRTRSRARSSTTLSSIRTAGATAPTTSFLRRPPGARRDAESIWLWVSAGLVLPSPSRVMRMRSRPAPGARCSGPCSRPLAAAGCAEAAYAVTLLIDPRRTRSRGVRRDLPRARGSAGGIAVGLAWSLVRPRRARIRSIGLAPSSARRRRPGRSGPLSRARSATTASRSPTGSRHEERYVDVAGRRRSSRRAPAASDATTAITRGGEPVALVLHDRALYDSARARARDRRCRAAGGRQRAPAGRRSLAQLADLRASRARIVEAGDAARTPARARPPRRRAAAAARAVVRAAARRAGRARTPELAARTSRGRRRRAARACGAARARARHLSRDPRPRPVSRRRSPRSPTPRRSRVELGAGARRAAIPGRSRPRPTSPSTAAVAEAAARGDATGVRAPRSASGDGSRSGRGRRRCRRRATPPVARLPIASARSAGASSRGPWSAEIPCA